MNNECFTLNSNPIYYTYPFYNADLASTHLTMPSYPKYIYYSDQLPMSEQTISKDLFTPQPQFPIKNDSQALDMMKNKIEELKKEVRRLQEEVDDNNRAYVLDLVSFLWADYVYPALIENRVIKVINISTQDFVKLTKFVPLNLIAEFQKSSTLWGILIRPLSTLSNNTVMIS